jgi:hypothetical protein
MCVLTLALALVVTGLTVPALMQPVQEAQAAPAAAGEDGVRDTITPTNLLDTGVTQALAAASGDGHKFVNNGKEFVVITNDYTATVTLTVVTGGTAGGHPIADVEVTMAAGATKLIGTFKPEIFNQTSGADAGRVYLNWSAEVTGTVANSVTLHVYRVQ